MDYCLYLYHESSDLDHHLDSTVSYSAGPEDLRFAHSCFEADINTSLGWVYRELDRFFSARLVSSRLKWKELGHFVFAAPRKTCAALFSLMEYEGLVQLRKFMRADHVLCYQLLLSGILYHPAKWLTELP